MPRLRGSAAQNMKARAVACDSGLGTGKTEPKTSFVHTSSYDVLPPATNFPAINAPARAPMVFMTTSVIVGYRTGEKTWYSSHVTDSRTPTIAASEIEVIPAVPRSLTYAKPKGM